VRLSRRVTFHGALMWVMGLSLLAYMGGLALHGDGMIPAVDGWLGMATVWVPAVVCWVAASRVGFRRLEVVLAAIAVTSCAAGDTYYLSALAGNLSVPFPSPGDVGTCRSRC